jgi:hypothetical protein
MTVMHTTRLTRSERAANEVGRSSNARISHLTGKEFPFAAEKLDQIIGSVFPMSHTAVTIRTNVSVMAGPPAIFSADPG